MTNPLATNSRRTASTSLITYLILCTGSHHATMPSTVSCARSWLMRYFRTSLASELSALFAERFAISLHCERFSKAPEMPTARSLILWARPRLGEALLVHPAGQGTEESWGLQTD